MVSVGDARIKANTINSNEGPAVQCILFQNARLCLLRLWPNAKENPLVYSDIMAYLNNPAVEGKSRDFKPEGFRSV